MFRIHDTVLRLYFYLLVWPHSCYNGFDFDFYSAGVGRTGTFICLDRLMRHMEDYNFVDILRIVCDMRSHRNFMVQTEVGSTASWCKQR